jgi:hypothetical protein
LCETKTTFTQPEETLAYYLVNEAAPADFTRQTLTTTDTVGCKNYLTVTVASAISTFASWNAATNKVTYTKVPTASADTVFGKHNINFAW